jgi:hypothetical protein
MFIIDLVVFFILLFVGIFPLGKITLDFVKIKLEFWTSLLISINIGIVLLTLYFFFLKYLGLNNNFVWLIFVPSLWIIFKVLRRFNNYKIKFSVNLLFIFLLFICTATQLVIIFPSGDFFNNQFILVGVHNHDSTWHLSLINEIVKNIPPNNPIYSGLMLGNYHYFFDVFAASVFSITSIPLSILYFKVLSVFLIIVFSCTIYVFLKYVTNNKIIPYFGLLFVSLTSNFYYFVPLLFSNANINPSIFWVQEYSTKIVNPQLLLSYIIITTLLILLISKKRVDLRFLILFSVLSASLIGFKIYGFILFMAALFLEGIFNLFKKNFEVIFLFISSCLIGLFYYLFLNLKYQQTIIFDPFWFIKTMYESKDHLNYPVWELKRQTYLEQENYLRIFQLYFEGTIIFLLGNIGGRFLGFFAIFNQQPSTKKTVIDILIFISALGLILPLLFIQKGTAWNTIQFFYYSVFSLGILTILFLDKLLATKRKILAYLLGLLLFISLLPGVFQTTDEYLQNINNSIVSKNMMDASLFLKNQEDGVVLVDPSYFSNSLISAFSGKQLFFADETQLSALSVEYNDRKKSVEDFFSNTLVDEQTNFLKNNKIKYIFASRNKLDKIINIEVIYQNEEVVLYKI